MCKADPQLRAWRFHAVEQLGRIVEMVAVEERRRKQPESRFHLLRDGLGEQDDIVRGFVTDPVTQSDVAGIVVIGWEQPPAAGIQVLSRVWLVDEPLLRFIGRDIVAVENQISRTASVGEKR